MFSFGWSEIALTLIIVVIVVGPKEIPNLLKQIGNFLKKDQNQDIELAAEDLRMATRHLGSIVGKVDVEEILGSIFKDFCIGK